MKSKSSKDEEKIETVKEEEPTVLTPEEEIQKLKSEVEQIARYHLPKAYRKRVSEIREKFGLK